MFLGFSALIWRECFWFDTDLLISNPAFLLPCPVELSQPSPGCGRWGKTQSPRASVLRNSVTDEIT